MDKFEERVPTGPKSYSQYASHKKCGFKFAADKVWRFEVKPQEFGPALIRGNEVHDSVENFFKGSDLLHPDLTKYKQWMWGLRSGYDCYPEKKWAFKIDRETDEWTAVEFDDPEASWRGVFDLLVVPKEASEGKAIQIKEWKTGRIYDDHKWQRSLYEAAATEGYPDYASWDVVTVYFDQKKEPLGGRTVAAANHAENKVAWRERMDLMDTPATYIPNPGSHCRWCPHSRFKGGKCSVG